MNYADGTPVMVGDVVRLGEDREGVVVCSIDDGVYTEDHPNGAWNYLGRGVMIKFPRWGLIHYVTPEPGLQLIARKVE
jgi:hypothetical protein